MLVHRKLIHLQKMELTEDLELAQECHSSNRIQAKPSKPEGLFTEHPISFVSKKQD